MTNLTLSLDDQLVERAREVARQQGTSLNAMLREYLERITGKQRGETVAERFRATWDQRLGHSGGWRFDREELYEERLNRGGTGG